MADLKRGWFCDHSPGRGKLITAASLVGVAGKYYFEFTATGSENESRLCFGICNALFDITNPQSLDLSAGNYSGLDGGCFISFGNNGSTCNGWAGTGSTAPHNIGGVYNNGDIIGVVVDTLTGLVWWRDVTASLTTWYGDSAGSSTPDPVAEVQGFPISHAGPITGNLFILAGGGHDSTAAGTGAAATLNAGASAFSGALPSTCTAWDTSGVTVLNPSDKASEITLSAANLHYVVGLVSGSNQPTAFVRTNTAKAR